MKKIFSICLALFCCLFAQALLAQAPPQRMTYQFVARNAQNQLIQNNAVGLRISILQGSTTGNAVYVETHTPQTNGNGTATIEVGAGTVVSGVFANIDWSTGVYYIQTEMDPQGQQGYSVTAVSQLLTVPYAFYAARSTRATIADSISGGLSETDPNFNSSIAAGITAADTARWNLDLVDDADNNPTNEIQTLTVVGDSVFLSGGGGGFSSTDLCKWKDNSNNTGLYYPGTIVVGDTVTVDTSVYSMYVKHRNGSGFAFWGLTSGYPRMSLVGNNGTGASMYLADYINSQQTLLFGFDSSYGTSRHINFRINGATQMTISGNGNVGLSTGTLLPSSKLHVKGGDVYVDNIASGVIMKSPNGSCWRVTVDNTGNLVRTAITCP
jgi:hypothetical protein